MPLHYVPPYRLEHYPEGLKGRYLASPSVAAHLGRGRVFSSRSEYTYRVSVDRKGHRRRRAWEVASRAAEVNQLEDDGSQRSNKTRGKRVAIDDLEDAARHRQRVWSGVDPAEARSVTPQFFVNIRRPRPRPRPTWSAVRQCVRTEEEGVEAIERIIHWQSTFALAADRELSYAGVVEAAVEANSDVRVKVECDEPDPRILFASPRSRSVTQPPASPDVQVLSRRPSFFADSPANVRVRIESEEPQPSKLAPPSSPLIKSEPQSVDNLVFLGQPSQAGALPSSVPHATPPVRPRSVAQPKVKSEADDDESILHLLSTLCQVDSPRAVPSLQSPVVSPLQRRAAPQPGPSPLPVVPFWVRADQDVVMREASKDDLRSRVVEPLHGRAGPAFASFSAFAATASPASPRIRLESRSEEDLAGLRKWHDGPATTTASAAPAPQSPQPPATPESPLFGGEDSDDDGDDDVTITLVKPAPKPKGKKAREAAEVQVKLEPTDSDIDALLDEIFMENQRKDCSPPAELPQPVCRPTAPLVIRSPAGRPRQSSPLAQDVEMDMDTSGVQHTHLPHVLPVIRPLRIRRDARPQAREARSPRVEDVKMEEDVQVVQVTQPLRRPRKVRFAPIKAEPAETETEKSLAFDEDEGEDGGRELQDVLWRELFGMVRDPDEWFRQPPPPPSAPVPAAVKEKPTASVPAALVPSIRVESASCTSFYSPLVPAAVGPLVKTESVEAALTDLTLSSNGAGVAASAEGRKGRRSRRPSGLYAVSRCMPEDADIASLVESFARLSIGSMSDALSSLPSEGSDSVVSYVDAEDRALESASQEVPVAVSSRAMLLVKEEPVEVSLSTPVLASNAPVACQSPYKRIISGVECNEEVRLPLTGHQSGALLLRAAKESSGCPLDGEPDCELPRVSRPHPGLAPSPPRERSDVSAPTDTPTPASKQPPVHDANQEKKSSELEASPSVFAAFLQRCTDAFHAQHPHEGETFPSEEEAIEIYELYEALPPPVRTVRFQLPASRPVDPHALSSTVKRRNALKDTRTHYGAKPAPKLPSSTVAVTVVRPPHSHSRNPAALSRRPRTDDRIRSNAADAVQGSGAPSSSLRPASRDFKQRAKGSFRENGGRGRVQGLATIPPVGEDGKLGVEVRVGESPLAVVLSGREVEAPLGAVLAPSPLPADDKNDLVDTGLAGATLAPAPTVDEDNCAGTVLACAASPILARVSPGNTGEDGDDSGSDTIRAGNRDKKTDSWHRPASRSDKGKERLLSDAPADDGLDDDLGFDAVSLQPEDYDLLSSATSKSKPLLSPRSRVPPIRLRLPGPKLRPHSQVTSPASPASGSTSPPSPRSSLSRAASLLKRCLGLKT